jgi:hypothetical protein
MGEQRRSAEKNPEEEAVDGGVRRRHFLLGDPFAANKNRARRCAARGLDICTTSDIMVAWS